VALDPKGEFRMDIVATPLEGKVLYVDTTIVNSASRSYASTDINKVFGAKDAEKKKKYQKLADDVDAEYITFSLNIHGCMSSESQALMRTLTTAIKARCADSVEQAAVTMKAATITTLSKALAFGNGTCLLNSHRLKHFGVNLGAPQVPAADSPLAIPAEDDPDTLDQCDPCGPDEAYRSSDDSDDDAASVLSVSSQALPARPHTAPAPQPPEESRDDAPPVGQHAPTFDGALHDVEEDYIATLNSSAPPPPFSFPHSPSLSTKLLSFFAGTGTKPPSRYE